MANKNRKRTFFDGDTEHGLVKRIMYKKYLQAYIEKTQSEKYTLRTMLIDGFAGVGRYGNEWPSEIERYGSPLIALIIALGVCYRKDMKKKKQQNEKQARSDDGETQGRLQESEMQNIAEGRGKHERSEESGLQANSEERAMHGRSQGSTAECETHGMTEENEVQNGQEENEIQGMSTLKESTGVQLQESSETGKEGQSTSESLWGWPASELDPEAQLEYELKQWNKRRTLCKKLAKISFIFIENNQKNYRKLCANVELLIMNFLKRCYPSHEYGLWRKKGMVRLDLNTDPFSISVKIVKGKFAETNPPSMLTGRFVRSLTFLDPFGFTQTPMSHVAKFAPGPGNEVFINFMSSYVNRFVSRSTEGVLELYGIDPPEFESDDELAEFVKYVIHFCQPEREQVFSNKINKCMRNYEAFLKRKTNSKYSLTFEVKDKRNTTIYHMIHITNHIRGVEAMKESMNRCSQKEGEMIMSEYDIVRKGQKLNLENLDDPYKVAEAIFNRFRGMKRVQIDYIQNYILFDTNYLFRKTPLKILQRAGKITDIVDTDDNPQKRKYQFPGIDKSTEEPIVWLMSFADEEYNAKNINSTDFAEAEKLRVREERKEIARKRKEQNEKEKSLKKEKQREKTLQKKMRKIENDEKKKKREEERLEKKIKKEERRRKMEENKRKRDEAKRHKEESHKRSEEKAAREMRSQKLMTDFLRSNPNQPVGQAKVGNAGKINGNQSNAAPMEVDNALGTGKNNKTDERRPLVREEPSGSSIRKETNILQGKENERNDTTQKLLTASFVSQKRIQTPLTEKATKGKTNKTRKRKVPETMSNKEVLAKRRAGTSGMVYSSSDNVLDTNEEISSNCEQGKKSSQKVLTEYFQRENNLKM